MGPKTIDEYLAALSDDKRGARERLRKTIRLQLQELKSASATSSPPSVSTENCLWRLAQPRITAPSTQAPWWQPTRMHLRITTPARARSVFRRTIPFQLGSYGSS